MNIEETVDRITIELTDDEVARAKQIARERHESYDDGRQSDTTYGDNDSFQIMFRGVKAELAVSKLFHNAEMDTTVSDTGDDGTDMEVKLGGRVREVDVKSTTYTQNPKVLMKTGYSHGNCDAVINTAITEHSSTVHVVGWTDIDSLMSPDNKKRWPYDHMNYVMEERELRSMPKPDLDDGRVKTY